MSRKISHRSFAAFCHIGVFMFVGAALPSSLRGRSVVGRATGAAPSFTQATTRNAKLTIWDGVYSEQQAERGRQTYGRSCSFCHRANLEGGDEGEPPLRGPYFFARWNELTVAEMFRTISQEMPKDSPPLTPQAYIDVISFLLKASEVPAGNVDLPPDGEKLELIRITKEPQTE